MAASCYFYMAFVPVYILILAGTIVIDYIAGIVIENSEGKKRKMFLVLSIISNVGILSFFKYYNFFTDNVNFFFNAAHIHAHATFLDIVLPIGLSFHTFQAMSYTIEVYRGNQKAERHFGVYALYVMFYPQLVAGPIERPQNMLHQFHEKHHFNFEDLTEGLKMMLWGFFKKTVIADRLSIIVNNVYAAPEKFDGVSLTIAVIFFSFQLFCDFSAYSDIALGAARVMGYKLMINFNRPFSSKSISEFWRRWHISLTTWFNDYVFGPANISMRNWGKRGVAVALILTFSLSGFWHGAAWKFAVYGLIQGIGVVYEFYTKKQRKKIFSKLPLWLNTALSKFFTLSYIIFSFIFFRAATFHDALYIFAHLGTGWGKLMSVTYIKHTLTALGDNDFILGTFNVIFGLLLILFLETMHHINRNNVAIELFKNKTRVARWSFLYFLIISIFVFGVFKHNEFIYFQF